MAEILSLAEERQARTPHLQGPARCVACKHVWHGVAPVGTFSLSCPACESDKAYFMAEAGRGKLSWHCNCGCDVFRIKPSAGPYCVNCGDYAMGWDA